ncbi:unnamed protein product [Arctogadus glacialis]
MSILSLFPSLCLPTSVEHGGVWRLKPSLEKYASTFTLDRNTAHRYLALSDENRKVMLVGEEQSVSPDVGGSSDTLTHIHTFQSTFPQDLFPGFGFGWLGSSVTLCEL